MYAKDEDIAGAYIWNIWMDFSQAVQVGGRVACLLKTVPKWVDDSAEKILRLDETKQPSASRAQFSIYNFVLKKFILKKILNDFLELCCGQWVTW